MPTLTTDDIDLSLQALDALPKVARNEAFMDGMIHSLMTSLVPKEARDDPAYQEIKAKAEGERQARLDALKEKERVLGERIVLLKAKLIQMKDRAQVDAITTI